MTILFSIFKSAHFCSTEQDTELLLMGPIFHPLDPARSQTRNFSPFGSGPEKYGSGRVHQQPCQAIRDNNKSKKYIYI